MKYIYFITLLVLATITLSSAQFDVNNLSGDCKSKLSELLNNKEINACFPLTSVASTFASSSGKIPDQATLKSAADAICGVPKCSNDLVTKTQNDVKSACQQDIANKGSIAQSISIVLDFYSPTRDSICFKNSTGGYCFIESSAAAQQILQTSQTSQNQNQSPAIAFASAPKEQVCTACNKAIFNTYFNFQKSNPGAFADIKEVSSQDIDNAKNVLTGKCGQTFIDGNVGDSTVAPDKFQAQASGQKNDATSLIANRMSFVVLVGSILATL